MFANKYFAGQYIPAHRYRVIAVLAILGAEQFGGAAEFFETGFIALGAAVIGFEEKILGDMVGEAGADHRIATEILDAEHAAVDTDFKILAVDLRCLQLAAL